MEIADLVPGGWDLWHLWAEVLDEVGASGAADAPPPPEKGGDDLALLDDDTTRLIGFSRVVARRRL